MVMYDFVPKNAATSMRTADWVQTSPTSLQAQNPKIVEQFGTQNSVDQSSKDFNHD